MSNFFSYIITRTSYLLWTPGLTPCFGGVRVVRPFVNTWVNPLFWWGYVWFILLWTPGLTPCFGGGTCGSSFSFLCCIFVICLSSSCAHCCQCLWFVLSWFFLQFSLTFIYIQWNGDDVSFVRDQHAYLDIYCASSLKQQSADGHFIPLLRYIFLIPCQPVFALTP